MVPSVTGTNAHVPSMPEAPTIALAFFKIAVSLLTRHSKIVCESPTAPAAFPVKQPACQATSVLGKGVVILAWIPVAIAVLHGELWRRNNCVEFRFIEVLESLKEDKGPG